MPKVPWPNSLWASQMVPANAGDAKDTGSIPWSRKGQSIPVFLSGKFHGQRSLVGYSPWGHRFGYNWVTDHTHTHTHRFWAADGVGLCNPWKNENKLYEPFRQPSFLPVGNLRAMGSEKEFKQSPVAFLRWGNGDQCSWRLTWMGVARQTHGQKRKQMKQKSDSLKKINKIDKS